MNDSDLRNATPDVCVIGAGPAGITAALRLGARGRSVVLLESGGLHASESDQDLNEGECEGDPYGGLRDTRHRQVGGTANLWNVEVEDKPGAKYVPLTARDLSDWPIQWDDLEAHYAAAQELCGLGPFDYGSDRWADEAVGVPFCLEGTGLESGVYQFGTAERFTRDLIRAVGKMEGVELVSSTTAVGLDFGSGNRPTRRVRAVRLARSSGRVLEVRPQAVILACGAVENARLLLLSEATRDQRLPWLGRGFMEHARDFSMVLEPSSPDLFGEASFYDIHPRNGFWVGGRLLPSDEALDRFDLPNASMTLIPRKRSRVGGGERGILRRALHALGFPAGVGRPGRYGWSRLRSPGRAYDVFKIVLNLEHRPDPMNRIDLGGRMDRFGNPLPRLTLRWNDSEQRRLDRLRGLLVQWFRAAELGELRVHEGRRPDLSAHHHAGTTRMGTGPEDGVVDPHGRVFGTDNLYAAGASVFPTAGFANPTLSIVALSVRLARYIDAVLD